HDARGRPPPRLLRARRGQAGRPPGDHPVLGRPDHGRRLGDTPHDEHHRPGPGRHRAQLGRRPALAGRRHPIDRACEENRSEPVVNLLNGIMQDVRTLILGAIILMAMVFVIMTWARTRSLVPTLGAVILGAVVIAAVASYTTFRTGVEHDITRYTNETTPPLGK